MLAKVGVTLRQPILDFHQKYTGECPGAKPSEAIIKKKKRKKTFGLKGRFRKRRRSKMQPKRPHPKTPPKAPKHRVRYFGNRRRYGLRRYRMRQQRG